MLGYQRPEVRSTAATPAGYRTALRRARALPSIKGRVPVAGGRAAVSAARTARLMQATLGYQRAAAVLYCSESHTAVRSINTGAGEVDARGALQ